jgi:PAS domain S-box-containing protein
VWGVADRLHLASGSPLDPEGRLVTFARVMGLSAQPIAVCDPDGRFYALDTALAGLLGYRTADLMRMDWTSDLASADSKERQSAALEELGRTGNPQLYDVTLVRRDGASVPVEVAAHRHVDRSTGAAVHVYLVADISGRELTLKGTVERGRRLVMLQRAVESVTSTETSAAAAQSFLDAAAYVLGIGGGVVSVFFAQESELRPVASFGQHSSLIRAMPSVSIDSPFEAAVVYRSGEAVFCEEGHEGDDEEVEGVARWRSGITAGSYAIVPLEGEHGRVGTLALHWPGARRFTDRGRGYFALLGRILGVGMERMRAEEDQVSDGDEAGADHDDVAPEGGEDAAHGGPGPDAARDEVIDLAFRLTNAGLLAAEGLGGAGEEGDQVRVTVTFPAPQAAGARGGFHDIVSLPGDRMALVAGGLVTMRGRDERAIVGAVRSALGSGMAAGVEAGGMLDEAARSVRAHVPFGATAGAALCVFDRASGAVSCSAAGPAWDVLVRSDGRLDVLGAPAPPLGGDVHTHASGHQLLLRGDRLVLCFGVPGPGAAAEDDLTDVPHLIRSASASGSGIGPAILGAHGGEELAATVVVLAAAD